MKKIIFPVILALACGVGFTACGGGGSDAEEQYREEEAKLNEQQAKVDRIKILQAKVADGTITEEEQAELDELYVWLEETSPNPGTKDCPDGSVIPEADTCP